MDPTHLTQEATRWGYTLYLVVWNLLPYILSIAAIVKAHSLGKTATERKLARDGQVAELQTKHEENALTIASVKTEVSQALSVVQQFQAAAAQVRSEIGAPMKVGAGPPPLSLQAVTESLAVLLPIFAGHAEATADKTASTINDALKLSQSQQMQRSELPVAPAVFPAPGFAPPIPTPDTPKEETTQQDSALLLPPAFRDAAAVSAGAASTASAEVGGTP